MPRIPATYENGRGVAATWTYTLGSIVFVVVALTAGLVAVAAGNFAHTRSPVDAAIIGLLLASGAVQMRYCWFLRVGLGGGLPRTAWTVALLAPPAVSWLLGLFSPGGGSLAAFPLWTAICLMACLLPAPQRWRLLAAGLAAVAIQPVAAVILSGQSLLSAIGADGWMLPFYGALLPVMLISGLWWWQIVLELDRHRRAAAELAVAEERLRFASDMHDIQGHHLQVIALKSELAERLLDIDAEAARANIRETRLIAKQAMEETRLLVAGIREVALDDELANAREVLAAAGAQCELDLDALPADPELRRALALAVREATTNILRHSSATRAVIRLRMSPDGCTLTVGNNGVSGADSRDGADSASASDSAVGSGLAGLRDRVAALGGTLHAAAGPAAGTFELRLQVPARVEVGA